MKLCDGDRDVNLATMKDELKSRFRSSAKDTYAVVTYIHPSKILTHLHPENHLRPGFTEFPSCQSFPNSHRFIDSVNDKIGSETNIKGKERKKGRDVHIWV